MSTYIWKYPLASGFTAEHSVRMLRPLHVAIDPGGEPCVWIEVDPEGEATNCIVSVVGTGQQVPDDAGEYVGTFQQGPFVWHVFLNIFEVIE